MIRATPVAASAALTLFVVSGCASLSRSREEVSFSETDDEARAFTVLVLEAKAPVLREMTFRFPIERQVLDPSADEGEGVSGSVGGTCGGLSGDNPFSGTGSSYSYCVFFLRAGEEGVWIELSLSWQTFERKSGEFKQELFFRWGEPTEQQLAPEVGVKTWFEAPNPAAAKDGDSSG